MQPQFTHTLLYPFFYLRMERSFRYILNIHKKEYGGVEEGPLSIFPFHSLRIEKARFTFG